MKTFSKSAMLVAGLLVLAASQSAFAQRAAADKARGDFGIYASPQPADTVYPRQNMDRVIGGSFNSGAVAQPTYVAPGRSFSYAPAPQATQAPAAPAPAPAPMASAPTARRYSYQPSAPVYMQPARPRWQRMQGYHDASAKPLGQY